MNKILLILTFFCGYYNLTAQEWQMNLETARTIAKDEEKKIVLVFQGSDWCAPCIKLEKEVWSTIDFKDLAKDDFVMLQADFPRRKKNKLSTEQELHNRRLAEKYNPNGHFPLVLVLDKNGVVLGTTGYEKIGPKAYFEKLMSF